MQFDNITYEVKGKVAIVTLNRPEKRNALSAMLLRELHAALLEADEYNPVHCVVLRGAGPHFCAGAAASRAMIADVALPSVFARLKGLRLDDTEPVRIGGWAFRGLLNLPARWDA